MFNTILLDNWNTLVQAPKLMRSGASVEIFQNSLCGQGIDYDTEKFTEIYRTTAKRQVAEAEAKGWTEINHLKRLAVVLGELGIEEPKRSSLAAQAWSDYLAEWPRQTCFYPDAPRVLEELKSRYQLGLVTNFMDGPTARIIFRRLNYEAIFGSLVVSAEIGYMKPSRVIFMKALEELNTPPENCVMVGDSFLADIVGAHNSGIKGVLIDHDGAQQEHHVEADYTITDISKLPELLRNTS